MLPSIYLSISSVWMFQRIQAAARLTAWRHMQPLLCHCQTRQAFVNHLLWTGNRNKSGSAATKRKQKLWEIGNGEIRLWWNPHVRKAGNIDKSGNTKRKQKLWKYKGDKVSSEISNGKREKWRNQGKINGKKTYVLFGNWKKDLGDMPTLAIGKQE